MGYVLNNEAIEWPASRRDSAYDRLLTAVIFGDLPPGAVVDEKQIATHFSLGLASVRDALARLALEGLMDRQARVATRIPDLTVRELQDVFEARILLEGHCAGLAAQRAEAEQIATLRGAFEGYGQAMAARDFRGLVRMDQVFHRTLAAATRNRVLEHQMIGLHNSASRFWYFGIPRMDPDSLRADIEAHLAIAELIAARDVAGAERGMRALLGLFPGHAKFFLSRPISLTEVAAR